MEQLIISGRLGADPEVRLAPGTGQKVANLRIAVDRSYTDSNSVRHEVTVWYRVTAWRKLAETVGTYLKKGREVTIIGRPEQPRPWTDKDGNMRADLLMTATTIEFHGRGDGGASVNGGSEADAPSDEPALVEETPF